MQAQGKHVRFNLDKRGRKCTIMPGERSVKVYKIGFLWEKENEKNKFTSDKEKCALCLQWPLLTGQRSTTVSRILHVTLVWRRAVNITACNSQHFSSHSDILSTCFTLFWATVCFRNFIRLTHKCSTITTIENKTIPYDTNIA